jgi:Fe-S cluster assembly ATP-binding protein
MKHRLDGVDILYLPVHERARQGLFLLPSTPWRSRASKKAKFLRRAAEALSASGESSRFRPF